MKSMALKSVNMKSTRKSNIPLASEMVPEPSVNEENIKLQNSDDSLIPNSTEPRRMNETADSNSYLTHMNDKTVISNHGRPLSYAVVGLVNVPDAKKLFDFGTGLSK